MENIITFIIIAFVSLAVVAIILGMIYMLYVAERVPITKCLPFNTGDAKSTSMVEYYYVEKIKAFKITDIVKAFKINQDLSRDEIIFLFGQFNSSVEVSKEYIKKHKPCIGGYYIIDMEGNEGYCTSEFFEKKYKIKESQND